MFLLISYRGRLMRAAATAAAIVLSACATQPSTLLSRAGQLTPGATTRDDAIAMMGRPSAETAAPGGHVLMQWRESQPDVAGAKAVQVSVLFDSRGRMVRITDQTPR
jgi:outer membrane protein assembly factor BamE (lipoprotein component of BamABCDE complex)